VSGPDQSRVAVENSTKLPFLPFLVLCSLSFDRQSKEQGSSKSLASICKNPAVALEYLLLILFLKRNRTRDWLVLIKACYEISRHVLLQFFVKDSLQKPAQGFILKILRVKWLQHEGG
jgi:hypothetical protein